MALRDQPYLPLYVQDFMTDEKLIYCSAAATGVYIRLMCIMHKSVEYGKICYNKNDNKSGNLLDDYARKLVRQMPYTYEEIHAALDELLRMNVICFSGEKLIQKRMVKDSDLSEKRAKSGKKGMLKRWESDENENDVCYNKTNNKPYNKNITRAENEIEYENNTEYSNDFSLLLSFLEKTVNSLPVGEALKSRAFHNAVYKSLVDAGYECIYEYVIPNGRIDILVKLPNGENIAIELDWRTPRSKNLIKLEGLGFKMISILREPYPNKSYRQFNVDGLILYQGHMTNHPHELINAESAETDFENVWSIYGKKGNKKTSQSRWERLTAKSRKAALEHIPKYVLATPDITYRKNFETYINQEAWNDEIIISNGNKDAISGANLTVNERKYGSTAGTKAAIIAEARELDRRRAAK